MSTTSFKKGHIPWNKNKKMTSERKRKQSEIIKKAWEDGKFKRTKSEEHKGKISISLKGHSVSEVTRQKIGRSCKGLNTWIKGMNWTEEHREKIRMARLKQKFPIKDTEIEILIEKELLFNYIKYLKQVPLLNRYIVDFYLPEYNLVIECRGDYWHANPKFYKAKDIMKNNKLAEELWEKDRIRDETLKKNGFKVCHFWEYEIKTNLKNCIDFLIENFIKKG